MPSKKTKVRRSHTPEPVEEEKSAAPQPEVLNLGRETEQGIGIINALREYCAKEKGLDPNNVPIKSVLIGISDQLKALKLGWSVLTQADMTKKNDTFRRVY